MREIRQIILLENTVLFLLFDGVLLKTFQRKKKERVTFLTAEKNRAVFTDGFLFLFLWFYKRNDLPVLPVVFLFLFFLIKHLLSGKSDSLSEKICLYCFLLHFYEGVKQQNDTLTAFKNALFCLSDRQKSLIENSGITEEKDRAQLELKCEKLSRDIADTKMDEVLKYLLFSPRNSLVPHDYLSVRREEVSRALKQLTAKKKKTEEVIRLLKLSASVLSIAIVCCGQGGRLL